MQTNLWQISKAYLGSSLFFSIAGEGLVYLAERRQWIDQGDYISPIVIAFSLPAIRSGFQLAGRVARLTAPPPRPGPRSLYPPPNLLTSAAAWLFSQPVNPTGYRWGWEDKPGPEAKKIGYREPNRQEFVFSEEGMLGEITESRLHTFCQIAWRRQQQVYYGNLASNRIFSREYFTKEARPRYPLPTYKSCIHILLSRALMTNRYKGGELIYPAGITVDEAKRRWRSPPT
jgi:hypothetical protein